MIETSRVRNFRTSLAKQIPKFPNDKGTLKALQAKSLGSLLIDYANWAVRYIAPRPRKVLIESTAATDWRWLTLEPSIRALLRKVEMGDDLTPHLSRRPHKRGFTPTASAVGPNFDRWADKDMLLNVTGYHHLHLDAAPTQGMRSDEVVFAQVTRDTFIVIGIFNHSVFDKVTPALTVSAERERLWDIFEQRITKGVPAGTVVALPPIANSGHSTHLVLMAANYARIVQAIDPKLDDPAYVRCFYEQAQLPVSAPPNLIWGMHSLDLCLVDKAKTLGFIVKKGPI